MAEPSHIPLIPILRMRPAAWLALAAVTTGLAGCGARTSSDATAPLPELPAFQRLDAPVDGFDQALAEVERTWTKVDPALPQPKTKAEFDAALATEGIDLKDAEEVLLGRFPWITPTGNWTPGPMNDPEANLTGHFQKHGHELKPPATDREDYRNRALALHRREVNEPVALYFDVAMYEKGYFSLVRSEGKTKEFSVMRDSGDVATYFLKFNIARPRFVKVPADAYTPPLGVVRSSRRVAVGR